MRLLKLWEADILKAYNLHKTFLAEEDGFQNPAYGLSLEEFEEYVEKCRKHSFGIDLLDGYVPDTIFILIDDYGNYVGRFNLRHYLNDFLEKGPGHIGYIIDTQYRRKGYGTKGLELVLVEAKKIGVREAYLSCDISNIASLKVQQKNGAIIHHKDEKKYYTRIVL